MKEKLVLGIDAGGTHTDAALLALPEAAAGLPQARLLASAKVSTRHEDLPGTVRTVLAALTAALAEAGLDGPALLGRVERATLGTTLAVNALVQGRADKVGLALSAGPGLDPVHFTLGEHVCIVPGGLDHRGVEVAPLFTGTLAETAARWPGEGVAAVACVGKFSPRNPAQEQKMGEVAGGASGLPVTLGHSLSGRLNFPRRVATAYYNAAVARLTGEFLDAVEAALACAGVRAPVRLLKADGGAATLAFSRREPVQSILSGPAASVMGVMALWPEAAEGCSLLLDMGGTTTDLALFYEGSPVVDRDGMLLMGRRTLVRALAAISIGVGGDSQLRPERTQDGALAVHVGPVREGPAMAFGGERPTLLDALNVLAPAGGMCGDGAASRAGMEALAASLGTVLAPGGATQLARLAVENACDQVARAAYALVEGVNARPIYTLAALKAVREARPTRACLVGGPAASVRPYLEQALALPVAIPPHAEVANAIGAGLAVPTAVLEAYADSGRGVYSVPALDLHERLGRHATLESVADRTRELLEERLAAEGVTDAAVEVVEADLFAILDDGGRGSRDMRVACQVRPGISARLSAGA
ncbi:MAG: hydantoinase/oxoprolinase family protein [Desulfovibrio sp.]|uniref:hydantoinase/oxoprolinase family protein n=1 Tax=Desulfovibrio sp. TaxID=885 RepID=UPI001A74B8C3|nr:hydantoinase/oxoprolinase family protein [Desulfovibrio sp.]MBD5416253.1 hydantoinase/oxoprolinase family protein [Desulfovibrio sp.]